jgi:hypothetical protein
VVFRWGVSDAAQEEEGRSRSDTQARERDKEKPGWEATLKAERPSVDQPKRIVRNREWEGGGHAIKLLIKFMLM